MADLCGQLTKNISPDCVNKLFGGADDRLILFNFDDIDSVVRNIDNPQIIEAILLASGKRGFVYQGKKNSNEPDAALVKQRFIDVYDHGIIFKAFEVDAAAKREYERMVDGLVIAILQNKFSGNDGDTEFEIYGLDTGLEVQELTRILADADTQGAYNIVLRSSEQSKEAQLPATLFLADRTTTKAIVEALIV